MNQNALSLPPQTFESIKTIGNAFAVSGMFGCKNAEAGMVLAMTCMMEGRPPTEIARRYHLIEGKLSMKAGAMIADFRTAHGGTHRVIKRDHESATIELSKDGETKQFSISWDQIKDEPFTKDRNGNTKANYATPRARMQMMWARLVSDSIEAFCPEVSYGIYTPEEVSDFPELGISNYMPEVEVDPVTHPGPKTGELLPASDTQSQFVDTAVASVECPITQAEIDTITSLLSEIKPYQADIGQKISAKIAPRKLRDLTQQEATGLIETLKAVAAKHRLGGPPPGQ